MNLAQYIICIIVCILQFEENNRLNKKLKQHFPDYDKEYRVSSAALIFLMVILVFLLIGKIIAIVSGHESIN